MSSVIQERADAANDSYRNRSHSEVGHKTVELDGQRYQVFGYANDPISGFHATAYYSRDTGNIIIAYRGTDPGLFSGQTAAEKRDHALTTVQDIAVDASMVRDTVNPQKSAADAFTQAMIDKAAGQGIGRDQITVAGHSLGGTPAEIEAAKYGLTDSTYNALIAMRLGDHDGQQYFDSTSSDNLLEPHRLRDTVQRYADRVPASAPSSVCPWQRRWAA